MEPSAKFTKSYRKEDVQREWWVVDATDMTVGRLSTQIATLLRGKHKAIFTPHVDTGDFVIVINAGKVKLEGKRVEMKEYFSHSGYPGGTKFEKFKDLLEKNPTKIIEHSVKGMIPKNRLGRQIIKKLKVYAGGEHPHIAQMPKNYELLYK